MTDKEKRDPNDHEYKKKKVEQAKARRHTASWSNLLILAVLLSGVLFAIYMIEKYQ